MSDECVDVETIELVNDANNVTNNTTERCKNRAINNVNTIWKQNEKDMCIHAFETENDFENILFDKSTINDNSCKYQHISIDAYNIVNNNDLEMPTLNDNTTKFTYKQ